MGCAQPGKERKSPENLKTERKEDSIGLKQFSCISLEGYLRRISNISSVSEYFDHFQKFTKLSFTEDLKTLFFSSFSINGQVLSRDFKVFCILLSGSPELEKAEGLWYVFDEGLKDSLLISQLKELISILLKVSVLFIPLSVNDSGKDSERLEKWQKELIERVSSLEVKLLKHFAQGKESLSKEEFLLKVQDRPEGLITSPADLRGQLERTQVIPNKFANPFKNMKVTKLTG
jgi:hypothetical protein